MPDLAAPPLASHDPVYGRPDAAAYLQISPAFLKKLDLEGRGPTAIRIGRRWLYRRSDLEAFLDRHRCAPAPEAAEDGEEVAS
ncbi:MAG: DNA-binding protein [Gammaproteobacteria bacterium]|nr:DNA-binding protein [Gammaproteobacteria bacterium]